MQGIVSFPRVFKFSRQREAPLHVSVLGGSFGCVIGGHVQAATERDPFQFDPTDDREPLPLQLPTAVASQVLCFADRKAGAQTFCRLYDGLEL